MYWVITSESGKFGNCGLESRFPYVYSLPFFTQLPRRSGGYTHTIRVPIGDFSVYGFEKYICPHLLLFLGHEKSHRHTYLDRGLDITLHYPGSNWSMTIKFSFVIEWPGYDSSRKIRDSGLHLRFHFWQVSYGSKCLWCLSQVLRPPYIPTYWILLPTKFNSSPRGRHSLAIETEPATICFKETDVVD